MSGLEGIAALGLACNILQLVGAVGSTITIAKNILETGKIDPDLEKRTDELTILLRDAEKSLSQASQYKDDQELRVAADQVLKATSEFKSELEKISGGASKGKIRQVIGGTVKGIWRRQRLDKLEAEVSSCRTMFESRLLLSLRHRLDLGAIQQEEGFTRLDNSLQSFVKGLSEGHTKLDELLEYQSTALLAHVTEESRQTREEISTAMGTVIKKMNQEEKQRFLGSLRYDTMNERRNRVEVAHPGTYKWIFHDSENPGEDDDDDEDDKDIHRHDETIYGRHNGIRFAYPGASEFTLIAGEDSDEDDDTARGPLYGIPSFIKSSAEKIYWISGKPGSGKSTLMKFMLENSRMKNFLNQISPTGTSTIASHFIWAAGAPIQRSLRGTLSSLLFQLLAQDERALEHLVSKYPNKPQHLSISDWSDEQLAEGLKTVCDCSRSIICLFIDGLDEIDSDDTEKILAVIQDLCTITHVKCIVSSRPEHVFSRHFQKLHVPSLRMQDLTEQDIRRYVRDKLRSWSNDPHRVYDIMNTICKKAAGVFLWVALALKGQRLSAEYEDDHEIVAHRFKQLPSELSELYRNMWDRLNDDKAIYGEEGAKYLNTYLMAVGRVPHLNISMMAFATNPTLTMQSFKPSCPSSLEDMGRMLEKVAVWVEVRTAGLIEVDPHTGLLDLVHKSAFEFLQNDAIGFEILGLDPRTEGERILSLLMADLAVVKHKCDVDRLGESVFSKHYKAQPYDICRQPYKLSRALANTMRSYKHGEITKATYFKILDQAASTYHAIRLLGNKYPFRQCWSFLSSMSGDFLGFMVRTGFIEYVLSKVGKYSTEKTPSIRYLEYLWAEAFDKICGPVPSKNRVSSTEPSLGELSRVLLSLLPQRNSPSPASLLGGYQRTATGLICQRPLLEDGNFNTLDEAANNLRDVSPEHHVLLRVYWNKPGLPNHFIPHALGFNILTELPLKILVNINNERKRWISQPQFNHLELSEKLISEMAEVKPGSVFIQSRTPSSPEANSQNVSPERYFSPKSEEDRMFLAAAVVRHLVQTKLHRWAPAALINFVRSKIAHNGFEAISQSQFDKILIERGHAFMPSQEQPWPPAMFDSQVGPGAEDNSETEDYHLALAAKDGYPAQVYTLDMSIGRCEVVIEGDVLRVVRKL